MSLYSTYWYRVAEIKPRLRRHISLFRHSYRGQKWYVLKDSSSGRQHRFNRAAYGIIGMMDGTKTVQQIWDISNSILGDDSPTQDDVITLLGRLHASDVLQSDFAPDDLEILDRRKKHRNKWKGRLTNPFSLRFPLIDPDRFLVKWMRYVAPLLHPVTMILWLLVVGTAFVLAVTHWPELTRNVGDRILKPENLILLWFVYPIVKSLHELGHAFVTRIWGGEVHEMGIVLLAFTPIPYVEASASATFSDKRKRMGVAFAGMAVELFIASLALFLWLNVEEGRVSALAYNVMIIGGVSTILFNGNPLLRFDGYYILADLIEIPNLAKRSTSYLGYLLQRYLFGLKELQPPVTAEGERPWFICYGIASFFYRFFVLAALTLFISSKFFFLGVIIAGWAITTQVALPLVRNSYNFYNRSGGRRKRSRFVTVSLALIAGTIIILFVLPAPLRTRTEGFVTLPELSKVRAGTDCFITEIFEDDGAIVEKDQQLIRCEDPYLESEVMVLEANLAEVKARYHATSLHARVERGILKEELASVQGNLERVREKKRELIIQSPNQGQLVLPVAQNLVGRFVEQGDLIGYIMGSSELTVTVVVKQSDIRLVREQTKEVELRLIGKLNTPYKTTIDREIPAASELLPSPVLGTTGGGKVSVDPTDSQGIRTLQKTFQIEVKLPIPTDKVNIGQRVYALLNHGYEPLAHQWYRVLRQLFLSRFNV